MVLDLFSEDACKLSSRIDQGSAGGTRIVGDEIKDVDAAGNRLVVDSLTRVDFRSGGDDPLLDGDEFVTDGDAEEIGDAPSGIADL